MGTNTCCTISEQLAETVSGTNGRRAVQVPNEQGEEIVDCIFVVLGIRKSTSRWAGEVVLCVIDLMMDKEISSRRGEQGEANGC